MARALPVRRLSGAALRALVGEPALLLGLGLLGLVAHGLNMFGYPAFTLKDDEGIYVAQSWAILRQGRLAPYTYWYDHAPAGWILIAAWSALTGGVRAFGAAVDSARGLMLVLHVAMVPLLYRAARKLGAGPPAAALALFLFSVSPLAVFYQRMVLLDSIMLFWLLLSLDLLLDGWGRLSRLALSGGCFGLACLSKESAVFFLPALVVLSLHQRWRHQGRFAVAGWLVPLAIVMSWYPLFAALKGELLPAGQGLRFAIFNIESSSGVSLIDALRWQASRGGGGLLNLDNSFWRLARGDWLVRDPVLFGGGALASLANLLRGWRDRSALVAALLGLLPLLYLGRGGLVFDYYVLAVVPFFCLNLALLFQWLAGRLPTARAAAGAGAVALLLLAGYLRAGTLQPLYLEQPSQAGREAVAWIKANVPPESLIVGRDDLWTDLHEPGPAGPAFPGYHSHWKVASDPAVRGGVFRDDWRTVDYLVMSPGLRNAFVDTGDAVALEALAHAHLVRRWTRPADAPHLHPEAVVELWKVDRPGATERRLLAASAAHLTERFERDGAYVGADGTVNSESQAYALLRAVWTDDRAEFDRVWRWTSANLRRGDGLLAWLWRDGGIADANSAADADVDAALALLLAGRRWNDPSLLEAGTGMVRAIWAAEVATAGGAPHLVAGNWAGGGPVLALNPSYLSPYAFRVFQEVDPEHDWRSVVDSSYRVLFATAAASADDGRSAGLPPDWIGVDAATGALVRLDLPGKPDPTRYGYDAARTYWRIAVDRAWSGDGRATRYLEQAGFLRDEVARKGFVSAVYDREGRVVEASASMVGTAGALAALRALDPAAAGALYARQVVGVVDRRGEAVSWGDPDDLYTQEWAWFAIALYADRLPDLWRHPDRP